MCLRGNQKIIPIQYKHEKSELRTNSTLPATVQTSGPTLGYGSLLIVIDWDSISNIQRVGENFRQECSGFETSQGDVIKISLCFNPIFSLG